MSARVPAGFSPERAKEVFQVAREALANVARHASATGACMTLRPVDGRWVLRIADNRVGLDPARADGTDFGLRNMRERARRMGGALTVTGSPVAGTEVKLSVASDCGDLAA